MGITISEAERLSSDTRGFIKRAISSIRDSERYEGNGDLDLALHSLASGIVQLTEAIRCLNYEGGEGIPYPEIKSSVKDMEAMSLTRKALKSILLARKHLEAAEVTKDAHRATLLLADAIGKLASQQQAILDGRMAARQAGRKRSIFGRR